MKENPYWLNGAFVREVAKDKPYTLKQMSEDLGFDSRVLYCYMQNAYKIPLDRLKGIAKYLNVSLESLIKEDDSDDSFKPVKNGKRAFKPNLIMINRIIRCKKTNDVDVIIKTIFKSNAIQRQTSFLSENVVKEFIGEHYKEIKWYEEYN